jgi:hypothetical protein
MDTPKRLTRGHWVRDVPIPGNSLRAHIRHRAWVRDAVSDDLTLPSAVAEGASGRRGDASPCGSQGDVGHMASHEYARGGWLICCGRMDGRGRPVGA